MSESKVLKFTFSSKKGFVKEIFKCDRDEKLGKTAIAILELFTLYSRLSPVECYRLLNKQKKISEKVVREIVGRLEVRRFLEQSSLEGVIAETDRKKTYLSLSSFGMYYLISKIDVRNFPKSFLQQNLDNKLFKVFLFPYITKGTISEIKNHEVNTLIFTFLKSIFYDLEETFSILKTIEEYGGVYSYKEFILQYGGENNEGLMDCLDMLEKDYNIRWKDNSQVRLLINKKSNSVKISDEDREICIKISTKEKSATISENGNPICKLSVTRSRQIYEFDLRRQTTIEEWMEMEDENIDIQLVRNLCLSIIDSYNARASSPNEMEKNLDVLLISKDFRFKELLKNMELDMRIRYANFCTLYTL